ncbi:MAG: hypothetical protein WCI00_03235 [bacterium]
MKKKSTLQSVSNHKLIRIPLEENDIQQTRIKKMLCVGKEKN